VPDPFSIIKGSGTFKGRYVLVSTEIEIEFKNIVTAHEFKQFLAAFKILPEDFWSQDNLYFDTSNFALKEKHSALRIRKKKQQFELTLKTPAKEGLLETNQLISEFEATRMINNESFPKGDVLQQIQALQVPYEEIVYFGTLTTKRAEIPYLDGLLVFDHNFYLNEEDFEIEYEVKEPVAGEQNFMNLMKKFNVPLRPVKNKVRRFYETKKNITK